jgi:hypothetical protein
MTFHDDICWSCKEYFGGYCSKYKEYTGCMNAHHPECGKLRFWEYEEPADEKKAEFTRELRAALKNLREALSCGGTDVESLTYNYKFSKEIIEALFLDPSKAERGFSCAGYRPVRMHPQQFHCKPLHKRRNTPGEKNTVLRMADRLSQQMRNIY